MDVQIEDSYDQFINIHVSPGAEDFNRTSGLCGLYDNSMHEDLIGSDGVLAVFDGTYVNDFAETWRCIE